MQRGLNAEEPTGRELCTEETVVAIAAPVSSFKHVVRTQQYSENRSMLQFRYKVQYRHDLRGPDRTSNESGEIDLCMYLQLICMLSDGLELCARYDALCVHRAICVGMVTVSPCRDGNHSRV